MTEELVAARRQELLGRGYSERAVDHAINWALKAAKGVNDHALGRNDDRLFRTLLPTYLDNLERFLEGLGHDPDPMATGTHGSQMELDYSLWTECVVCGRPESADWRIVFLLPDGKTWGVGYLCDEHVAVPYKDALQHALQVWFHYFGEREPWRTVIAAQRLDTPRVSTPPDIQIPGGAG